MLFMTAQHLAFIIQHDPIRRANPKIFVIGANHPIAHRWMLIAGLGFINEPLGLRFYAFGASVDHNFNVEAWTKAESPICAKRRLTLFMRRSGDVDQHLFRDTLARLTVVIQKSKNARLHYFFYAYSRQIAYYSHPLRSRSDILRAAF